MKKTLNSMAMRASITAQKMKDKLQEQKGQFVMDNGVTFVIILVIGGVVLAVLSNYIENEFSTLIKEKITAFFN